jgi:DNA mismatch repair ATPase MutS
MQTFFLVHLIACCRSNSELRKNRKAVIEVFECIGSLDASISISSYIEGLSYYVNPVFNNENRIDVEEIYHPLLENPVSNNIRIENNSVLITGSNMAGKTTFIRTVAVNILLARTLNICLCKNADIPFLTVKSLIKREDSIDEGKSYFFREVEGILELIKLSSNESDYLFLIDEIFRGTNTVERISSAKAVLEELSGNNIVLVTTHDLELQDLLKDKYTMHHFSEQVEGERYFFDYKVKNGPCSSRNAIKLLELKGYPERIIKDALELSEKLSR